MERRRSKMSDNSGLAARLMRGCDPDAMLLERRGERSEEVPPLSFGGRIVAAFGPIGKGAGHAHPAPEPVASHGVDCGVVSAAVSAASAAFAAAAVAAAVEAADTVAGQSESNVAVFVSGLGMSPSPSPQAT